MPVEVKEHIWIPLSDGCRLGARIWLPEAAAHEKVPAILEYIPYRKRDGTRGRDDPMHGYFAQCGYAAVRVDMRGSGESDGLLADEYLKQEQDDALEVIEWIARQSWCSGAVGMQGKSWGGFNALQIAARRPPALKAIITTFSTDNRYSDDVHYMGGCLLNDNLWWGSIMLAYQSRPLDPLIVGPDWRARWLERIEALPFFPGLWLEHQRYDAYWKHGSVCEDFGAIACPVLAIGGWTDSYTSAVLRLLEGLKVPRLGIIGPWGHVYPHDGTPGPAIGYLQEAVRWWGHWLKGRDTGIMREPMLRAYLEDPVPPTGTRTSAPGRWVGERSYPSPDIRSRGLHLRADRSLGESPGTAARFTVRSPQSHGKASGEWMGTGCPGEQATDQRLDDGGALVFDTATLNEEVAVLGTPVLRLRVAADVPVAQLAVRLSDVAPDEQVTRVSYQLLNLTHREGDEQPAPLEPGRLYDVAVALKACGHRFVAGHRIRLAIATAYWPLAWPAPYPATLTVVTEGSRLELPVRSSAADKAIHFPPPVHGPHSPVKVLVPSVVRRFSTQDHVTGETTYVTEGIGGVFGEGILRFEAVDVELAHSLKRELTIRDADPLSARYVLTQSYEMGREGWRTRIETRAQMHSDRTHFFLRGHLSALLNGEVVAERDWDLTIARDYL
ncbi:MAG TPA: CocE/NonD family hydrolase [Steroidobacteraceae bacterium]|nr:CocE/NonD family hydrolase [Steroidobacteraceae bacterium]